MSATAARRYGATGVGSPHDRLRDADRPAEQPRADRRSGGLRAREGRGLLALSLRRGVRLHGGRHVLRGRRARRSCVGERGLRPAYSARPRARAQADRGARRPAEADARDLPNGSSLVRADLPLLRAAGRRVGRGRVRTRQGRRRCVRPVRRAAGLGGGRARAAVLTEPPVKVTSEAARRFLVTRHFLAPARSLAGGPDAVLEVIRKLGSIQFDPIAVAGRNHDLMLHARVAGYEPAWCDALYERRKIFETTNKALSFIPASEFPWYRMNAGRKGPRFHAAALKENAAVAERALERIRAAGPLSSADSERESGRTKNWFGMPENAVRSVLEAYTVAGEIGLARREGNIRYYDVIERLLPAKLLAKEVPEREQLRHKQLSRHRAHGLLGAGGAGGTFARIADPEVRREVHKELVDRGELVRVDVAGSRTKRFVVRDELALLESPPEPPPSVAFIAPFDSLLWDTALLASLFDFEFVWEGFFKPEKRRWGYYGPPILFGDRFVGRIEPRIDHEGGRVEVLGLWWEAGFAPARAAGFVDAMRGALRAYLRFADADRVEWAPGLAAEKRLFGTRP